MTAEWAGVYVNLAVAIIGGVAASICFQQLREMQRQLIAMQSASQSQSLMSLVEYLQSEEVRNSRRVVRSELPGTPVDQWTPEEQKHASAVAANFDVVAALLRGGICPPDLIAKNWGPAIIHCYDTLKPFIEKMRMKPGGDPLYWSNFEWLYKQSVALLRRA